MEVPIETIEDMQKIRVKINSANIMDIEFTKGGEVVEIAKSAREYHKFTGLNNIDFITSGAYKEKFKSPPKNPVSGLSLKLYPVKGK